MENSEMRRRFFRLVPALAALVLFAGLLVLGSPCYGKEKNQDFHSVKQVRYVKKTIRLYHSPSSSARKGPMLKKSYKIKVIGVSKDGWSKVSFKKKDYYLRSKDLAKNNGYLVAIDAGHQQKGNSAAEPIGPGAKQKKAKVASGATGRYTGIPEYKLTLRMAKKLEKELKFRGYKVKMIRTKNNVNISNSRRAKIANKAKADAFIRIHANGSSDSRVSGALTIAPAKNNKYCKKSYKKSKRLSQSVLEEFCRATGAKNRGVMYTNSMSGINWSKVPVTIVEMGFLSNKKEDKKMNKSSSYQKKMVKGMANGIDQYFKRLS